MGLRAEPRGTEQNGAESKEKRNTRQPERARSGEARADCGKGAACLLAHLSVLNLYVVSATGSAPAIPPRSHRRASPHRRETGNPEKDIPAPERGEKEQTRRGQENKKEREAFAGAHRERYIFPGRVAVAKSSQESRTNRRP